MIGDGPLEVRQRGKDIPLWLAASTTRNDKTLFESRMHFRIASSPLDLHYTGRLPLFEALTGDNGPGHNPHDFLDPILKLVCHPVDLLVIISSPEP
jgi:hypothetical protein